MKEDANIRIKPVLTKEQVDYDNALKDMKYVSARLRISQEGVNTSNISIDTLDNVIKLFDEMELLQRDFNIEAQKIQQESNNKIATLQGSANKKFADVQNKYRELITLMKGVSTVAKTEDGIEDANVIATMTKEKEEEIKKVLAKELADAQANIESSK